MNVFPGDLVAARHESGAPGYGDDHTYYMECMFHFAVVITVEPDHREELSQIVVLPLGSSRVCWTYASACTVMDSET